MNRNSNGFSILALVIIIVFLGMIVGGIIFTRHLMTSADAMGLIARISKYESQIALFQQTYKAMPGDSASFSPPGDANEMLNDQLGMCARTPDDTLSNEEQFHFWSHMSQGNMLDGEKFEPYSPKQCGGSHDENWLAPSLAGVIWPYVQLDPKAAVIFGAENGDKAPIVAGFDPAKKRITLTFYINAVDATPFERKFKKEQHDANQVDLVNLFGKETCKTTGLDSKGLKIPEFVNCKDKNAGLAKFVYTLKN